MIPLQTGWHNSVLGMKMKKIHQGHDGSIDDQKHSEGKENNGNDKESDKYYHKCEEGRDDEEGEYASGNTWHEGDDRCSRCS